jgi:hypothetical protein
MTSGLGPMIPGKNITFQGEEFGGNQDIYIYMTEAISLLLSSKTNKCERVVRLSTCY